MLQTTCAGANDATCGESDKRRECLMSKVLVGMDGTSRGMAALSWALTVVSKREGSEVELLNVLEPGAIFESGMGREDARKAAEDILAELAERAMKAHPGVKVTYKVEIGKVVDTLVEESHGMSYVVMGSHHGHGVMELVGGARGLRVSAETSVPVVVVPCDWVAEAQDDACGVVAAVAPDDSSSTAVGAAAQLASDIGQPLKLITVWGVPSILSRPARAMGGELPRVGEQLQQRLDELAGRIRDAHPGLEVTAQAIEGASPSKTISAACEGTRLLVLGSHHYSIVGRTVYGSMAHSILLNLTVPTVIVPNL